MITQKEPRYEVLFVTTHCAKLNLLWQLLFLEFFIESYKNERAGK